MEGCGARYSGYWSILVTLVDYFPAFLDLRGRSCLLIGAREIALRKARLLLAAGAQLTVVAPQASAEIEDLATRGALRYLARKFRPSDVTGQWLVICATDVVSVQRDAAQAAGQAGVFCNLVDDADHSSYITPAIVDRGPVVVAVSSGGAAPVLARQIRAQIESLLPATVAQLASLAREWRDRVHARVGDLLRRRYFWESVFEGRVARQIHRGAIGAAHETMQDMLDDESSAPRRRGEAWLAGAGPGDPELLTLKALQAMQAADVIVHDRLVPEQVLSLARRDARQISVGKTPGCRKNRQEDINALLVDLVASGKRVCRLKGGDPFIFGRGGEEAAALEAAGLPYQVIPGITAAAGCAAYAGIPLTHRDLAQSVVLLTAHGKDSVDRLDWPSLARDRQTLAVYMAVRRFPELMNKLIEHGRPADTPIAIIEQGTTPNQRVIRGNLGQLTLLAEAYHVEAPAMLIIGAVANFGEILTTLPSAMAGGHAAAVNSAIQQIANNQ